MDIGSIFLILAVLVPVVLFIARPLMEGSATAVTAEEHQYSALLAERDRILNAVQELDFDYALGKIPNEEYPNQRASLMRVGAEILRKIDEYEGNTAERDTDALMETPIGIPAADATAVAIMGETASASAGRKVALLPDDPDDKLEALIANRRRSQKENDQPKSGGFCPQCGNCVQESDRFCPKCGRSLS